MANITSRSFLLIILTASWSACAEDQWSGGAYDEVCLLQFLDKGHTAQIGTVGNEGSALSRVFGDIKETQAEPCCGANPTQSTASSGLCHETGVDVFARHEDLLTLFGDNVAMNPDAYKFFLETDCDHIHAKVRCTYAEITDPDVYGHAFPVGKSNVKIKGIDISGNSYECTKTLYVYDEEAPVFTTPVDERAAAVVYPVNGTTCNVANKEPFDAYEKLGFGASATDNCDRDVTIVKQIFDAEGVTKLYDSREGDPQGSFTQGPGEYRLVYLAIDDYSENIKFPEQRDNLQTTHSATLRLEDRESPSKISDCPSDINVTIEPQDLETKEGTVNWTIPHVIEDNCLHVIPAPDAEEVEGKEPGMSFPVGATRVKYVFKDGSNNVYPEECKFTVTVVQKENPVELTCPEDITAETLPYASFALVSWAAPVATQGGEPLEVTYPQGVASGMPFPFGITDVQVKAVGTLPAGIIGDPPVAACFFTVTVLDPEDPMCDGRSLQCAAGDPTDKPGMASKIKPYAICEGPQLNVSRHEDFETTHEYETLGAFTPSYSSCCTSELDAAHACVPAAPGSPTKYCKPDDGLLLGADSEDRCESGIDSTTFKLIGQEFSTKELVNFTCDDFKGYPGAPGALPMNDRYYCDELSTHLPESFWPNGVQYTLEQQEELLKECPNNCGRCPAPDDEPNTNTNTNTTTNR